MAYRTHQTVRVVIADQIFMCPPSYWAYIRYWIKI